MNIDNIDRSSTDCVSLRTLESYALGGLSGEELNLVMDHLKECGVCSRQFELLVQYLSGPPESYSVESISFSENIPAGVSEIREKAESEPLIPFPRPEYPSSGQIWLVRPGGKENSEIPLLVLLLPADKQRSDSRGTIYPAAVISWETEGAADRDLIMDSNESPLGIDFIIETWNRLFLSEGELNKCLGILTFQQLKKLTRLLKKKTGKEIVEGDIKTGLPITSLYDERIFFQSRERRRAERSGRFISGREGSETRTEPISRAYSLAGVSATVLLGNLRLCFKLVPDKADSATRSFFLGLKKFYQKYLIPAFPIAIGLAIPVVARIFFKKLSKSLDKSKIPSSLKPESELLKGLSYCGLGRWQDALNIFSRVMASPLTLFAGLVFSAWILARMGKFKQASESLRKARNLPQKERTFQIDFARIERFIEEEREAEFKEWFDNTIGNYILKESARLISSL